MPDVWYCARAQCRAPLTWITADLNPGRAAVHSQRRRGACASRAVRRPRAIPSKPPPWLVFVIPRTPGLLLGFAPLWSAIIAGITTTTQVPPRRHSRAQGRAVEGARGHWADGEKHPSASAFFYVFVRSHDIYTVWRKESAREPQHSDMVQNRDKKVDMAQVIGPALKGPSGMLSVQRH